LAVFFTLAESNFAAAASFLFSFLRGGLFCAKEEPAKNKTAKEKRNANLKLFIVFRFNVDR
jgi:hypothetical protein